MEYNEILVKAYELKDNIVNSEMYKDLKEKEKKMLEDEECSKLLYLYQEVQNKYNEAKRFEKYGGDIATVSKELSDIKCKVNENCYVKEYNLAYKRMNKELKNIENMIFKDIIKVKKQIDIE